MRRDRQYAAPADLFTYFSDGNTQVAVNPDPPTAKEAKPFHVLWRGSGWIPVSVLVFARDAKHAKARVHAAMVACRDGQYVEEDEDRRAMQTQNRCALMLESLDAGKLVVHCKPVDVARIIASVNWAANGGF